MVINLSSYLAARHSVVSGDWISKIGEFLVGQITETDFISAASSANSHKNKGQHCEAGITPG
jgi:hypothetical protein